MESGTIEQSLPGLEGSGGGPAPMSVGLVAIGASFLLSPHQWCEGSQKVVGRAFLSCALLFLARSSLCPLVRKLSSADLLIQCLGFFLWWGFEFAGEDAHTRLILTFGGGLVARCSVELH